jgi:hypothetical protein
MYCSAVGVGALGLLGLATALPAATINVNTTSDTLAGVNTASVAVFNAGATRSLRGAIVAVNNDSTGPHTINLPAGTYTLTLANATPTTAEDAAATGDLDILKPVTIIGAGSASVLIRAGTTPADGIDKIFSVNPLAGRAGFAVSLSGVTLRYGRNPIVAIVPGNNAGGAMDFDAGAGGMGSLTLTDVAFDQNSTTNGDGGALALFNGGTITATNCRFTANAARSSSPFGANGGALFVGTTVNPLAMACTGCVFESNSTAAVVGGAAGAGGAVFSYRPGTLTIANSRIVGNAAATGATALAASPVTSATIAAANNWYGSNAPAASLFSSGVTYSPNLVLSVVATPATVVAGQASASVVAGITRNSDGAAGFSVPDGTPVVFSATLGTIAPGSSSLTAGTKSAAFSPGSVTGNGSASATVDGQTVNTTITVVSPFVAWQQQNFGANAGNPAIAGEAADPDADGLANLLEYALGSNPQAANASGVVVDTTTGALRLTAPKVATSTDITYLVEASGDMVNWTASGTTIAINTATQLQVRDNTLLSGGSRRFIRLRVSKP